MATDEPTQPDGALAPLTTDREYIRVQPTTAPIHPSQVTQAARKLHALTSTDDGGLFGSPTRPTVEMLLITPAGSQQVEYLFGIADGQLDALDRVLGVLFPNDYERTRTSTSIAGTLTGGAAAAQTPPQPSGQPDATDRQVAGLELQAQADRAGDWRTRLTEFETFHERDATDTATWPLGIVIETLAATACPVVVQTLLRPKPDWTAERDQFVWELKNGYGQSLVTHILDALDSRSPSERPTPDIEDLPPDVRNRIDELEAINPRRCLHINTRAIAVGGAAGNDPATVLTDLEDAFSAVGHTSYQLTTAHYDTGSKAARRLRDDVAARTLRNTDPHTTTPVSLPVIGAYCHKTRPRIVADPTTAGSFVAVGGASLPEPARRAIRTKSQDSVPRPLPPRDTLDDYRGDGFELGPPQTTDGTAAGEPLAVPPALQRRHLAIVGQTGAGKGMLAIRGLVRNHAATDGATIIVEPKDGTFADDYCRAHYAAYETLEDVYRFDAHEYLPAAPILDIEPAMASGLSRTQAVAAVTDQLEAMLRGVMGAEDYEAAATSSRVIRAVTKSLFDPVHGETQCTIVDLQETLARMERTGSPPPVASDQLRRTLADIVGNSDDTFTEIIRAATRRLDEVASHEQLAPQFTYAPAAGADVADTEPLDWREKLDEDCVFILDTSALDRDPQRVLTLLTLSQLWTALRRRRREHRDAGRRDDLPLVNIHIEEAADIAASGVLGRVLKEGRGFGVGVSLSMQFLGQLDHVDARAYAEAINNTGTVIAGQTNRDPALAERLATSEVPRKAVATRLRALDPGEWCCSLTGSFDSGTPQPFTITSGPLPPGHPDGPEPLSEALEVTCRAGMVRLKHRSRTYGLPVGDDTQSHATAPTDEATAATTSEGTDTGTRGATATDTTTPSHGETTAASVPDPTAGRPTLDTTGPFTNVMPDGVTFSAGRNAWVCTTCETAHGSSLERLLRAVDCHGDRTALDRAEVPAVTVDCSITRAKRDRSPYNDHQLVFLQLLYNAWQFEFDPAWEFDLVWDDMEQLVASAGLDDDGVQELITGGLLVEDTTQPHTIYSLTAEGRDEIDAPHREGVAHGDGRGDLSESTFHRMMVETMCRVFRREYVDDPSHPGTEVRPYYGVEDGRLDVVVLDADDEVVIAGEAERANNDMLRATPDDFDKMAACDPDQAIWVVPDRATGHEVITALHNPVDRDPRVPKTYNQNTPMTNVRIETDGFTKIFTIGTLRSWHLSAPE